MAAITLVALACGGGPEVRSLTPRTALGGSSAVAKHVELRSFPERPPLAVVTRDGDPSAALAVTVHGPDDAAALAVLAEVVAARLEPIAGRVNVRVDRRSLLLDVAVDPATAPRVVRAVRESLETKLAGAVKPGDLGAIRPRIDARLAALPVENDAGAAKVRACLGQPGVTASKVLDPASRDGIARVEAARLDAFSRDRAAFAVVGPSAVVDAVESAIESSGVWPAGQARPATDPDGTVAAATAAATVPSGSTRLTVAVRTADPIAAVAGAERLGQSPSPLGARVLGDGFRVTRAAGVADPAGGGCLAVTLERRPGASDGELREEALANVLRDMVRETGTEIERGAGAVDLAERIARTEDARQAAELAAWWAQARPLEAAPSRPVAAALVEVSLDVSDAKRTSLQKTLEQALASAPPAIQAPRAAVRVESGQAQTWVLVANPCAAVEEVPHRWGLSALAAVASARAHARADTTASDVTVDAFVSSRGVGFLAHGSPREGETAAALAERVARSASASFFDEPARTDELLEAQETALFDVASRWSNNAPGLAALGASAMDRPALIEPFGPPSRLARFEAGELARRLHALAEGPVRIAVLAREDADAEGKAAEHEIARWVGGSSATACEAPPKLKPGRTETREARKGATVIHFLLPLEAGASSLERARVVAAIVAGPKGLLSRGAMSGPTVRAVARTVGTARSVQLLVSVAAPDENIAAVEAEVTELLKRLARGEVPDAEIARGIADEREAALARLSDPRERIALLFEGAPIAQPAPLKPADLKAWIAQQIKPDAAAIVVARPE
ncbi:MAG: hypothetical protein HOW73_23305 [Polyangiaceae bacterium]|nr:hypothetical protein [Polyangiaceae bacterium]